MTIGKVYRKADSEEDNYRHKYTQKNNVLPCPKTKEYVGSRGENIASDQLPRRIVPAPLPVRLMTGDVPSGV